jgi:hypothetical protein
MLQRDVQEGGARLGQNLLAIAELAVDADAPPAAVRDPRGHRQCLVDEHRAPEADEDPCGHRREAVPGGEEAAGFVQRGADDPAVDDPRRGLASFGERERRLVALDPLRARKRKMDAVRIVPATPARLVVMRRNALYRKPPRSKCAL